MRLPNELNLGRSKRLPVIVAAEASECGVACLAMIARFHGHDIDLNGLRQRFAVSLAGINLAGLMSLAHQLDLSPRALRAELGALRKLVTPCILHWDLNHFVVLKRAERQFIIIHDPALGSRRISIAEASKHFTGVALELTPVSGFRPVVARTPIKLSMLWSKMSGAKAALTEVLLLSLALQIAAFAMPFQLQLVVDEAVFRADADLLKVIAVGFLLLVILQAGIEALRNWALRVFGHVLTFQVVGNLVRHLMGLPASFFEKRHIGDIMSRLGSVQPIQDAITRGIVASIIDGLMALIAAVVLFFYSATLAIIVLSSILIFLLFAALLYPSYRARLEEEILVKAKESTHLMETVRAATTIKLLGCEGERESSWRNRYADVINAGVAVGKFQITQNFLQQAITGAQTVIVIFVGARLILLGDGFSVGMLFAFLSFRQTFTDRTLGLINQTIQFRLLGLHLDRLSDIVNTSPDSRDDGVALFETKGGIFVDKISFRYGTAEAPVIENLTLKVEPGEFVAISGPSGSGKTTLLKLMLGLHQPESGNIWLDDHRATADIWRAWRKQVGAVMQEDRLLSGTLADNIAFFDPNLQMKRVIEAAKSAKIYDDVMRLPMQFLSLVGDMGTTLSAGQRQRVLLARALYRQPKLIFLDEGTANLDEETEEMIWDLIASMPITRIVVAHRQALICRANRVFQVKDKRLVEQIVVADQTTKVLALYEKPKGPNAHQG